MLLKASVTSDAGPAASNGVGKNSVSKGRLHTSKLPTKPMRPRRALSASLLALAPCTARGGFDDWALVAKYCPPGHPAPFPPPEVAGETFYVYRDKPVYQRTLQRAFDWALGRVTTRFKADRDSEFSGEVLLFCELLKHPQRTWDQDAATLFVVPAFPTLVKESPSAISDALRLEPGWLRSRGADHLVLCTGAGRCASRLGNSLFEAVALPGLLGSLERNSKWLDPRLHRLALERSGDTRSSGPIPLDLARGDHPLCPERTIVLPYPAHNGIVSCRRQEHQAHAEKPEQQPAPARGATTVFFAGTLREAACGVLDPSTGLEQPVELSHGVRPALTTPALLAKYGPAAGLHGSSSSLPGHKRNAFTSASHLHGELLKRGYHLLVLPAGTQMVARGRRLQVGAVGEASEVVLPYERVVERSIFCLHLRGDTPTSRRLFDAIAGGCLPIIVSDDMGLSLPFSSEVNYSAWVTIISEAAFVADPLGEIDKVVDALVPPSPSGVLPGTSESKLMEMQRAMAKDAPTLTLCGGTGAAGDALIRQAFRTLRASKAAASGLQSSGRAKSVPQAATAGRASSQRCAGSNNELLRPLYATFTASSPHPSGAGRKLREKEQRSAAEDWVRSFKAGHGGNNCSWCTEVATRGVAVAGTTTVVDWRGQALHPSVVVHANSNSNHETKSSNHQTRTRT